MSGVATFRIALPDALMPHSYIPPLGKPFHHAGEESGLLFEAIEAWGEGKTLTQEQFQILKNYLCHWAYAPCWKGDYMYALRADAMAMTTAKQMKAWLDRAFKVGIKPW